MSKPKYVSYSAASADPGDRRSICRHPVVRPECWLGWWEGQDFEYVEARIVDISLRGALLVVGSLPPAGRPVWLRPQGAPAKAPDDWLEAHVIGKRKRIFGHRSVRISLKTPFPYEVFKSITYVPDAVVVPSPRLRAPEDVVEA